MKDLFADDLPRGDFVKFDAPGETVQGTYVGKREAKDGFGNDQVIYVIKKEGGETVSCGIKSTVKNVHEEMVNAKLGEIVAIRFDGKRPSKNFPGKFYNAFSVRLSGEIDAAWVAEHPGATIDHTGDTMPVNVGASTGAVPQEELAGVEAARKQARNKGLAQEAASAEEVDAAITAFTGLAVIEANVPEIITKLAAK